MRPTEVISSTPIPTQKSRRYEELRCLSSGRGGKFQPLAYIPMLREDRVSSGKVRVAVDMAETIHPLMNAVNVTVQAWFVPFSAFPQFNGLDEFNRSYQGIPEAHNSTVIPFFDTITYNRTHEIWKALGIHHKQSDAIRRAPIDAYNLLWNFRARARSSKITQRSLSDTTLAPAFWKNPNLWHIKPDFDQAMNEGEVPLILSGSAPVKGLGFVGTVTGNGAGTLRQTAPLANDTTGTILNANSGFVAAKVGSGSGATAIPAIFAELTNMGVTLSLANIEMAKKTAAFAKLREQYSGISDDHLVDLLMEGVRIPEEAMREPILLDTKSTVFGYQERFATDGASLDKSVTTGKAMVTLNLRTPPMNTGGIILITSECVPEALFERMQDEFLRNRTGTNQSTTTDLPNFLRDYLDPEKVEVVQNRFVDVEHGTPNGTFGYVPLNSRWNRSLTRIGGKFFRPIPDTFVEDRQRFWSVEQLNPALTSDFYVVNNLPHSVFADSAADPFEYLTLGRLDIVGNTVFGSPLKENEGLYDQVATEVDATRLTGVPGN